MKIWIMRHGEASFNTSTDSQRFLTENGKQRAFSQGELLGKRLLAQQLWLDKIIVSPYLRTQQTFEQVTQGIQASGFQQNFANLVEYWEGITPAGDVDQVEDYLAFLQEEGAKNVLLISHLPLVFDLVHTLTQNQASVHFYPAVIAELEWNKVGKLISVFN